jgi:hypothetical protein
MGPVQALGLVQMLGFIRIAGNNPALLSATKNTHDVTTIDISNIFIISVLS